MNDGEDDASPMNAVGIETILTTLEEYIEANGGGEAVRVVSERPSAAPT